MAIDNETKRASVLNAGSHAPGKGVMQSEPDGSDLDTANQRGFVLWHYAGIAAAAPVAGGGRIMSSLTASGGLAGRGGIAGRGGGLAG